MGLPKTLHHLWAARGCVPSVLPSCVSLRHRELRPASQRRHFWESGHRPAHHQLPQPIWRFHLSTPMEREARPQVHPRDPQLLSTPFFFCKGAAPALGALQAPLQAPCSHMIRYSSRPAWPKLLKLDKAALAQLGTSFLRQRPKGQCPCVHCQYPSLGVHGESSGPVPLRKSPKWVHPGYQAPMTEHVESICNSASSTENSFLTNPEKNLAPSKVLIFLSLL